MNPWTSGFLCYRARSVILKSLPLCCYFSCKSQIMEKHSPSVTDCFKEIFHLKLMEQLVAETKAPFTQVCQYAYILAIHWVVKRRHEGSFITYDCPWAVHFHYYQQRIPCTSDNVFYPCIKDVFSWRVIAGSFTQSNHREQTFLQTFIWLITGPYKRP